MDGIMIREVKPDDAESLYHMFCELDAETIYMMYEPGERKQKHKGYTDLKKSISNGLANGDFINIALVSGEIIGVIWAERGNYIRTRHSAYIVVGIRKAYQGRGIGSEFFRKLDQWAMDTGVERLELTVDCPNETAIALYKKAGFEIEGIRHKSMKVNGQHLDEYYMAKLV